MGLTRVATPCLGGAQLESSTPFLSVWPSPPQELKYKCNIHGQNLNGYSSLSSVPALNVSDYWDKTLNGY